MRGGGGGGSILIPPPTYAARRKGTQRLRCSLGRCSRGGSLKAAFRWWYQDAPGLCGHREWVWPVVSSSGNLQARLDHETLLLAPRGCPRKAGRCCPAPFIAREQGGARSRT